MPAIRLTRKSMVFHFVNSTSYKSYEKDESYNYKEPGDKGKEFARGFFPEFCKQ
jgi:hypothetical protein